MRCARRVGGGGRAVTRLERQSRAWVASQAGNGEIGQARARCADWPEHRRRVPRTATARYTDTGRAGGHPHRTAPRRHHSQHRLAYRGRWRLRGLAAGVPAVIRIDSVWLAVDPIDMRAGAERLLARVVQVFGAAQAHHGYLFANARASRIKLLVHDGFGVWCAARRLNAGSFEWPRADAATPVTLTRDQFDALVLGLPWQRLEQMRRITWM